MQLSDVIVHCGLVPNCHHLPKQQLVEQMLLQLANTEIIPASELPGIAAAVMRREGLGSTGIGKGLAMPHARHAAIPRLLIAAFLFQPQVPFDCIDGEQADIFFLFLSPPDDRRDRNTQQLTQSLHQALRQDEFLARYRQCTTAEEIRRQLAAIP